MKRPNIVAKQHGIKGFVGRQACLNRRQSIWLQAKLALQIFGRFSMSADIFMSGANKDTKNERDGKIYFDMAERK